MNRHSLLFALACAVSFAWIAPGAEGGPDERRRASVRTGRFTVTLSPRGADESTVVETILREVPGARLVARHRVLRGRGFLRALVFDTETKPLVAGSRGGVAAALQGLADTLGARIADEVSVRSRGKPVNLPILETDWNRSTVTSQAALLRISAYNAQTKATGAGQTVAVLDGGFDLTHEFLEGRLAAEQYDALDGDDDAQDLGDGINGDAEFEAADSEATDSLVGHGTFVSSLVLAAAPDATILPVRVLDDEGWGTDLSIASGISYAVEHGASVVNMSLVLPETSVIVRDAVRAAQSRGVVIVTASGTVDDGLRNDYYLTKRSICVAATGLDDVVAPWCLVGSYVHIFAPGVDLAGAVGGAQPDSYGRWSGVSFAVPFVSAGAAMIREQHPTDWSAREVRDTLRYWSAPAWFPTGDRIAWRGRVDLNLSVPAK